MDENTYYLEQNENRDIIKFGFIYPTTEKIEAYSVFWNNKKHEVTFPKKGDVIDNLIEIDKNQFTGLLQKWVDTWQS